MTIHRLIGVFLLFLVVCASVMAQPGRIDSLGRVLEKHPQADTFRVNRLNELAKEEIKAGIQPDSTANLALGLAQRLAYPYGQAQALSILAISKLDMQPKAAQKLLARALPLANSVGDKVLLRDIVAFTGLSYWNEGERALPYLKRAVTIAKTTGQPALITSSMNDLGAYYYYRDMSSLALNWYFQALRVAEKAGLAGDEVSALRRIADVYLDLTDYDRALSYLFKARQKIGPPETKLYEILILGDIGTCYRLTGRYAQAIMAYRQGLKASKAYEEIPDYGKLDLEAYLADTYERQGNALALPYARRVLANAQQQADAPIISRVSITLGHYHLRTGRPDSAIYYGRQGFLFASQSRNTLRLRDASQVLAQAYAERRDFANAYAYQSRYIVYKDSISNDEVTRKATAAQFNDQMSRQRNQIALLTKDKQLQAEAARRQRQLLYGALTVLALIGGLLVVLYRSNRQQQRSNELLRRQKAEIEMQRDQTHQALTELKATQIQLIQKEKMASLGELTAGIAHEIQNPLNFVNNFSEFSTELVEELEQHQQKPERTSDLEAELMTDIKNNLHKIIHHGQRASSIVKSMLEHSRTSAGEVRLTDLNALTDEYLRLAYHGLRAKAKDFNCELVTQFDSTLGTLAVRPQEIGRVLLNLFGNAFYAVQERQKRSDSTYRPVVRVSTLKAKSMVEIRVSDNGTGVPEGVKQKIFQPFFTTKPAGQGTGLGLSLSFDIITKGHNGSLMVESQEGEGAEFIIQLPNSAEGIAGQ